MSVSKKKNKSPEMTLITMFKEIILNDKDYGIRKEINFGTDKKTVADVEYLANNGEYIILEAKSHHSSDAYNTINKLFGQLLKEHGKNSDARKTYDHFKSLGILIPKDPNNKNKNGVEFYKSALKKIPEDLYVGFGCLAKVKYIFVCSEIENTVEIYSWINFYYSGKPIKTIKNHLTRASTTTASSMRSN